MDFFSYLVEQAFLDADERNTIVAQASARSGLLGRMLLQERIVNLRQMLAALHAANESGMRIGDQIVELGFATRAQVEAVASRQTQPRLDRYDLLIRSELIDEDTLLEVALAYIRACDHHFAATPTPA